LQLKLYGGPRGLNVVEVDDNFPPRFFRVPIADPPPLIEDYGASWDSTYRIANYQLFRLLDGSLCYVYTGETR
jgi:hypothetical protein